MPTKKFNRKKTRKTSKARPMRSLKNNYSSQNVYRFVRETMPETRSFTIIPAGTAFPAMGSLHFSALSFLDLVQATNDFGNLFARYKIDKIETILTPLFQKVNETYSAGAVYSLSPALRITRVNTKWFNGPLNFGATSDAVLAELAQVQAKSITNYASKRSLKLITNNPGVAVKGILDNTNTELSVRKPAPWLNITTQSDVPLKHNSAIFAERVDGGTLTTDWKYRVVHKIYFRCSQVG